MAAKRLFFKRVLVPSSFSGHSLYLHHWSSQPWLLFPASFAEYSFCFVQVVAGGGGGAVRFSERKEHIRGNTITGSICTQKDGSLWSPQLHLPR